MCGRVLLRHLCRAGDGEGFMTPRQIDWGVFMPVQVFVDQ